MHACVVKGRWIGLATVVIVTVACMVASAIYDRGDALPPGAFGVAGFWLGIPYGLVAGSALGWLAARVHRARAIVLGGAATAFVLAVDLTFTALVDGEPIHPTMAMLYALSIAPALIAALVLERWTRPVEHVPTAIAALRQ